MKDSKNKKTPIDEIDLQQNKNVFGRPFSRNLRKKVRKELRSGKRTLDPSDYGIGQLEEMQFLRMGTM